MKLLCLLAAAAVCILSAAPIQSAAARTAPNQDEGPDGNKLVHCTLHADRETIQPGSTFTLGVHFAIEPKWHVYWQNAGDSGLPTKADIKGPEGYEIGAPRFPWPKREEVAGEIVQYVHEHELMLLVDVKVPANAKPGTEVQFDVEGRWLVCTDVCVMGSGKSTKTLTVGEKEKPAEEALFAAWRPKMARPWSEMTRSNATWSGAEDAPKLTLVVPGATELEFFPYLDSTLHLESRKLDVGKQGSTLAIQFSFERKKPEDKPIARGTLLVKSAQGETSYVLEQTYAKK
jgi:DsbC/DsbD-like thiol-disulfide interchange protein